MAAQRLDNFLRVSQSCITWLFTLIRMRALAAFLSMMPIANMLAAFSIAF
jgi:hypothetical protein